MPRFSSENNFLGEQGAVVPTKQAKASRAIVGGTTIAENYAFVSVHHIFDQVRIFIYCRTVVRCTSTLQGPYFMRQLSFVTSCCCVPCMWVMSCLDYVIIMHEPTRGGNKQSTDEIVILYKTKIRQNIFFQHTAGVTMLKFANDDRSRLCCSSLDGTVSICNVTANPPYVETILKGHKKGVTGDKHFELQRKSIGTSRAVRSKF